MKTKLKLIFLLFFLSGVSGLIYEVIWTRMLTYLFGATIYAVATVLSSFMGGLALGSFIFGKVADRTKNNLKLYGVLEIGIGIFAFILPFMLKLLHPLYSYIYSNYNASFITLSLVRFVMTFTILLIPTTMMGATLPVLSKFLARKKESLGFNIGFLYALNTTGAVIGCFAAGFFFIAYLGISGSVMLAVILNILVGIAAIVLSGSKEVLPQENEIHESDETEKISAVPDAPLYPDFILKAVLFAYFISGFVSLSYQVVWSRALVFTFDSLKNTTYSFTAMLTVFLIGLALGSSFSSSIIDRFKNPFRVYALIQILIGLLGALSLIVIFAVAFDFQPFKEFNDKEQIIWTNAVLDVFAKTAATIFLPTFMMGMGFPIAARISVRSLKSAGKNIGHLYSFNTIGAIIGSFVCGFFLIPKLGISAGILVLSLVNISTGIILLLMDPASKQTIKTAALVFGIIIAGILVYRIPFNKPNPYNPMNNNGFVFQDLTQTETMVFYEEGALATVSVLENGLGYRTINVDNVGVAGTDPILLTDQKSLAHYPMLLLKDPKNILTVGFGSGGASWSYTLYDSLEKIHCAEICDTVLNAAPTLTDSNKGVISFDEEGKIVFSDKRYAIVHDDVRSYLNFTNMKYDVIATDCTDLRYKTNANLYDLEYFEVCKEKITDDGMVCVWMPLAGLSDDAFRCALRTFYKVFNHMSVWYINNTPTHYILLIGTKNELKVDYSLLVEKMKNKKVLEDLAEINLDSPDKLLSCFVTDERKLEEFLKGDVINTENYPYLEFQSPKYGYGDQPLIDNLAHLADMLLPVKDYLFNLGENAAQVNQSLDKYFEAASLIIKGHSEYRLIKLPEANKLYMQAAKIQPDDPANKYLLRYEELLRRKKNRPTEIWCRFMLGELYKEQGRLEEAVSNYNEVLTIEINEGAPEKLIKDMTETKYKTCMAVAECYELSGKPEKAKQYRAKAEQFTQK